MSTTIRTTVPTGYAEKHHADVKTRAAYALREFISNAINFKATKGVTFIGMGPNKEEFLVFLHNGLPFGSEEDVLKLGVFPNSTTGDGESLNGLGLVYVSGFTTLKGNHQVVVGSEMGSNGWFFGRGFPDYSQGKEWRTEDVTAIWRKIMPAWLNGKEKDYRVMYAVGFDRPTLDRSPKNILTVEVANMVAQLAPDLLENGFSLSFPERCINPYDGNEENIGLGWEGKSKGGSNRRPFCPVKEFFDRYMEVDRPYEFESDPFDLVLDKETGSTLHGVRATFSVFPCTGRYAADGEEAKNSWLCNVRDGTTVGKNNPFTKDGGSAPGRPPYHPLYLSLSCVTSAVTENPKLQKALGRFQSNAVYSHTSVSHIMRNLGLQYNSCQGEGDRSLPKPFVIVRVDISHISEESDSSSNRQPFMPMRFLQDVRQRPDFTIENDIARSILNAACEAAVGNIPKDLISCMEKLFPRSPYDCIPLGGEGSNRNPPKKRRFNLYDVRKNCEIIDRELHLGTDYLVVVEDINSHTSVSHNELSWYGNTRGVSKMTDGSAVLGFLNTEQRTALKNLGEMLKHPSGNPLRVVHFRVDDDITQSVEDSAERVKIDAEHYVFDKSCNPSRIIEAELRGAVVPVGFVVEIPKREQIKTSDNGTSTAKNNRKVSIDYYCDRPEHIICEFDSKHRILRLNRNHFWIKQNYIGQFGEHDQKAVNKLQMLHGFWEKLAIHTFDGSELCRLFKVEPPVAEEDEPSYDDGLDYLINFIIEHTLTDEMIQNDILSEVEKIRQKNDLLKTNSVE